ncbi:hypothetical protein GOBAR_DD04322 [Gossypium barbadense]|nr:hypothetical protein GOBAR_DD04322 [Gossypium barbadense]
MFTQGLDKDAFRWVRAGGAAKNRDFFGVTMAAKQALDPITSLRNAGLPPSAKFRNGHLSHNIIPVNGDDDGSESDMDISSDSEENVHDGQYSFISSPQDDKVHNVAAASMQKSEAHGHYGPQLKLGNGAQRPAQVCGGKADTVDKQFSDSACSTEVSYMQYRSNNGGAPPGEAYNSDSYSSTVTSRVFHTGGMQKVKPFHYDTIIQDNSGDEILDQSVRTVEHGGTNESTNNMPTRRPIFHASGLGPWCAVLSYDACVRLCLNSWAKGCTEEAPYFLNQECAELRKAFGLRQILLQPEEELLAKQSSELVSEAAAPKSKRFIGKMKVQVRKVKMGLDPPPGCNLSIVKMESVHQRFCKVNSMLHSGWEALRKVRVAPNTPVNGSLSKQSLAYLQASSQYIKEVSKLLKTGVTTLRSNSTSYEEIPGEMLVRYQQQLSITPAASYGTFMRNVSYKEQNSTLLTVILWWVLGIGVSFILLSHNFFNKAFILPKTYCCLLKLKSSSEDDVTKMQPGSSETHVFLPDGLGDDLIVKVHDSKGQYCGHVLAQVVSIADDPGDKLRWWPIYHEPDHELVGRIQLYIHYSTSQEENNLKCGSVAETVAYDLLMEVAMKVQHFQERNLLLHGPWKWLVCEGMMSVFKAATGSPAPALVPAIKLYSLLHDILTPEIQLKFCGYFQAAAKKRSRRHQAETDEFILTNNGSALMDPMTLSMSYQKMKFLISSIKNEIFTDIEIHKQNILPSFIDLPNLSVPIYSADLCSRLRAFLVSCPPPGPSRPVIELVIATADFQRDLSSSNIKPVKGGVEAKELFHSYITCWIEEKRHSLLDSCKLDKVKCSDIKTSQSTTPFIDDMYDRLTETLNEYEIIISRWPEFTIILENAVADVEKAIIKALERQYADVLAPLKDGLAPKIIGKYVQKFTKGTAVIYVVPDELGVLLNSMKRILFVLHPKIETKLKSWCPCTPPGGNAIPGERLSEITVMLRADFRNHIQAIVEKLAENTKVQTATKLKKIIQDSKETVVESDVRSRMQPLKDLLINTIENLHSVFEPHVFITVLRNFWDRMGQDVLHFMENRRENMSWYKGLRIAISVLDEIFAAQMQKLLGNALQEKDLEPPPSVIEVRSMFARIL